MSNEYQWIWWTRLAALSCPVVVEIANLPVLKLYVLLDRAENARVSSQFRVQHNFPAWVAGEFRQVAWKKVRLVELIPVICNNE